MLYYFSWAKHSSLWDSGHTLSSFCSLWEVQFAKIFVSLEKWEGACGPVKQRNQQNTLVMTIPNMGLMKKISHVCWVKSRPCAFFFVVSRPPFFFFFFSPNLCTGRAKKSPKKKTCSLAVPDHRTDIWHQHRETHCWTQSYTTMEFNSLQSLQKFDLSWCCSEPFFLWKKVFLTVFNQSIQLHRGCIRLAETALVTHTCLLSNGKLGHDSGVRFKSSTHPDV